MRKPYRKMRHKRIKNGGIVIDDVKSAYGGASKSTIGVTGGHIGASDTIALSIAIGIGKWEDISGFLGDYMENRGR